MAKNEVRRTMIIKLRAREVRIEDKTTKEGDTIVTLALEFNPVPPEFSEMIQEVLPNFGWKIDKLLTMEALVISIIE